MLLSNAPEPPITLKKAEPIAGANLLAIANYRFEFQKSRQLFLRAHNETLSVVAMCVGNPRSFARWNQSLRHSPNSTPLC
jgi:hypothetical protein